MRRSRGRRLMRMWSSDENGGHGHGQEVRNRPCDDFSVSRWNESRRGWGFVAQTNLDM